MIRYGLVGAANSAVGFGTMAALALLGAHYSVYTAAGYGLAFLVSYALNGRFTFRSAGRPLSLDGLGLFAAVNGALLLLVEAAEAVLIEAAGVPEPAAVLAGVLVYFGAGFALNRRVVYRPA